MVEAVAAECVWIVADAATVEDARAVFHVRDVTASSLIEMGLPEDKVLAHRDAMLRPNQRTRDHRAGLCPGLQHQGRAAERPQHGASCAMSRAGSRCDTDGDNRAELIHVHMLGNATSLVQWERCDEIPLACFTPYREPGRIIGSSQADMVMDLQRVESRVMRAVLDSLGQAMFPRTAVVIGQANLADVTPDGDRSIIRVAQQGAVAELVKPFAGKEALPVMDVLEAIRESTDRHHQGVGRADGGRAAEHLARLPCRSRSWPPRTGSTWWRGRWPRRGWRRCMPAFCA